MLAVASAAWTASYFVTSALDENKKNIELMGKNIELTGKNIELTGKSIELMELENRKNIELAELRAQADTSSSILDMAYGAEYAEWRKQLKKHKGTVTILYKPYVTPSDPKP